MPIMCEVLELMQLAADLHIHSCLSPCAEEVMTPNNIVNMAFIKKLSVIAVTDHNSAKNLPAVAKLAMRRGLVLLPGLEVQSREEVHLLCYFESVDAALQFGDEIYEYLPDMPNRVEIFGKQLIMDENDEVTGVEQKLLIQSLELGIDQVVRRVKNLDGLVVPAHINKNANSILYNLGFIPPGLSFPTLEVSKSAPIPAIDLAMYRVVYTSDAHDIYAILEPEQYIEAETCSARGVLRAMKRRISQ